MRCIVFGLSLLDRTNISSAYIAGLDKDLKLNVGARYNVALLIFFVPYALFELPSNLIIRRLGARYWLGFLITAWGACVLGMGFVKNWELLTVLRALLGLFEAGCRYPQCHTTLESANVSAVFPGAIYIIGSWYRQFETAKRVSVFYMASLLASGFGPIVSTLSSLLLQLCIDNKQFAYVLSLIRVGDGMYRAGWRWIFIVEGIATVVAGLLAPFFLIECTFKQLLLYCKETDIRSPVPERVRFLTDRQKHIAINRVSLEKAGQHTQSPTFKQSLRMLMDWKIGV
jgi:MFS family permease